MEKPTFAPTGLRYLSADHLHAKVSCDHVDVWNRDEESIGTLDGVIVDREANCLRYLVVKTPDARHSRILVPFVPTQVDARLRALRVDVDPSVLSRCEPFDPRAFDIYGAA